MVLPMATSPNPVPRILVIAHEEPIGEIVVAMLRGEGYDCDSVCEQKAIFRVLKRAENYSLLVCQVAALEETKKLLTWALGAGRDIPIVACAVRNREHVPKVIYERCTFLQLPFEREQLLTVVRETLNATELSPRFSNMRTVPMDDDKIRLLAQEIVLYHNSISEKLKTTPSVMENGALVVSKEDIMASRQRAVDMLFKIIKNWSEWTPPPRT